MGFQITRLPNYAITQSKMISVLQLGSIEYAIGLRLQQKLVDLRKDGRVGDVLLLLEHTPVITLGRNAKRANVVVGDEELSRRGIELFDCDRGGDVTFHGPGQLVGYPIFDLRGFPAEGGKRKTLGVIEYVRRLEEVLIRACADFQIPTERVAGLTGVWTAAEAMTVGGETGVLARPAEGYELHDKNEQGKLAAIGVHISRGVTSHGFALNVNIDLSFFDLIVPCGIVNKPVTSMEKELGRAPALQDVAHSIARNFGTAFHSQVLWLETLDALLEEKVGVPARPPEELRRLHKEDDIHWA
jgi:lipoyl(octanoyl) transferase